ncbi:MAG: ImmA/IrrE family metallo-endopeptidase [Candidatus Levybacteria bacterium]|nr:ImmA/IrrE family metallo-endopeptidase [Candidatus Levybacteria bacterium]
MIRSRLAREKAQNILSMYRITEPPVDVEKVANLLGFQVVPFDFPDTTSAVIRIKDTSKVIGVNKNQVDVRQRFSLAHELGHYLSGHENFTHEKKMFVEPDKKYLDPQHRQEEEADEFAAELLMPEPMLKKDVLENKLDTAALAKKYNVSEQAMWIQLINLKLAGEQSRT